MNDNLTQMRTQIDRIDYDIISAVQKRMILVRKIAAYKKENSIDIIDKSREDSVLAFFEDNFESKGMGAVAGRMIAEALIDIAISEENQLLSR